MRARYAILLLLLLSAWPAMKAAAFLVRVSGGTTSSQSIASIGLSGASYSSGSSVGTVIGAISVTMTPVAPAFVGTLSLTGSAAADFSLSSTSLPANLITNSSTPACSTTTTFNLNIMATQNGSVPFSKPETIICNPVVSTCPQGTTYVSVGDGCQNAQSSGTKQVSNFFTGFTGTTYSSRPPWNVAAVDYPVGYSGSLSAPTTSGCMSVSGSTVTITGPCTVSHIDFTTGTGSPYCIALSGSGAVTLDNVKIGVNNTTCGSTGMIVNGSATVTLQYCQVNDNGTYSGQGTIFGTGSMTVQYCDLEGISGRVENVNSGATGSYAFLYNYYYNPGGTAGVHGEISELNTAGTTPLQQDSWNVMYTPSGGSDSLTSYDYMQSQQPSGAGGDITQAIVSYNVEVTRPNGASVTVPVPTRIDTSFANTLSNLTITNNYYDPTGGFNFSGALPSTNTAIFLATSSGGAITASTCSGNKYYSGGAWGALTGTTGISGQTFTCN